MYMCAHAYSTFTISVCYTHHKNLRNFVIIKNKFTRQINHSIHSLAANISLDKITKADILYIYKNSFCYMLLSILFYNVQKWFYLIKIFSLLYFVVIIQLPFNLILYYSLKNTNLLSS